MTRIPAVLLAVALASQTGCAHGLTKNQSNGMIYGGGAAVFMGGVVIVGALGCNEIAGGDQACEEHDRQIKGGAAVLGVGLILGALGYFLRPEAHSDAKPEPPVADAE